MFSWIVSISREWSYSHSNSDLVYPELAWLEQNGFNIWHDEGIEAGAEWREEMLEILGSKITHTERYRQDHDMIPIDQ